MTKCETITTALIKQENATRQWWYQTAPGNVMILKMYLKCGCLAALAFRDKEGCIFQKEDLTKKVQCFFDSCADWKNVMYWSNGQLLFLWPIQCFKKHFPIAGMSTAVIQVAALDYKDRCIPISMPVRLTRPPVLEKTGQYPWLILWMGFKNLVQKMSHPAASSSSAHIPLQSRTLKPKEPGSTWEQLLPWIPAVKCSGQINLFIFSLDISYPPLS